MSADKLLRFRDLKSRGIVSNPVTLARWQANEGFPSGFMLGPNTRVYRESEVEAWLAARPTKNTFCGLAKKRRKGGRS
jgi:predicted DNA-binding transcriptional regulator AlpA